MQGITILPWDCKHLPLVERLQADLERYLNLPVTVHPLRDPLDFAFDSRRSQYNSSRIIERVGELHPSAGGKTMALVDVDLFLPVLTYVFGEAHLNGTTGVVSCARLRNEFHGRPADPGAFYERLLKEMVHELGHTFGLRHCAVADCVMFSSHDLEDTDAKDHRFCTACRDRFLEARREFQGG